MFQIIENNTREVHSFKIIYQSEGKGYYTLPSPLKIPLQYYWFSYSKLNWKMLKLKSLNQVYLFISIIASQWVLSALDQLQLGVQQRKQATEFLKTISWLH